MRPVRRNRALVNRKWDGCAASSGGADGDVLNAGWRGVGDRKFGGNLRSADHSEVAHRDAGAAEQ